jgi:hypothetical protein
LHGLLNSLLKNAQLVEFSKGLDFGRAENAIESARPLRAAGKLIASGKKCQGTTLVLPQAPQNQRGLQPLGTLSFKATRNSEFFRLFSNPYRAKVNHLIDL